MALLKCKMCGGTLDYDRSRNLAVCPYCGSKSTVFEQDRKLLEQFQEAFAAILNQDGAGPTPSHTGLYNVVRLLEEMPGDVWEKEAGKRDRLEVIYVTRTYITRHGAGRLDHECTREAINPRMVDRTNLPNPWQNSLRYARHPAKNDFLGPVRRDLEELDRHFLTEKLQIDVTFRLTHLDETDGRVLFADGSLSGEEFEKFWRGYL